MSDMGRDGLRRRASGVHGGGHGRRWRAALMLGKRRGFPTQIRQPHSPRAGGRGRGDNVDWLVRTGGRQRGGGRRNGGIRHSGDAYFGGDGGAGLGIYGALRTSPVLAGGAATGAIAGTCGGSASGGTHRPVGGLNIGAIIAGILSYGAAGFVKRKLNIDDSSTYSPYSAWGGIVGTLLVSVLALDALGGFGFTNGSRGFGPQLGAQAIGVAVVMAWVLRGFPGNTVRSVQGDGRA